MGVAGLYYFKSGPFSTPDKASIEENKAGNEIKKRSLEQTTDDNDKTQVGSDPAPNPQPIEGSSKQSVGMEITAANQDESTLHIRTLIQTVASSGTCTLNMTGPNNKQYSASVDVQSLPSSTTCKGFDIPLTSLTPGTWKIAIEFNNETLLASTTKEVVIK
jgi:hypothetical protein